MEIRFKSRETSVYRESFFHTKRTQESAECVVPDTEADIEKIAAVQSEALLKSKDLTGRGILISGEVSAVVLYIREGQDGLASLYVRKPFTIEFETEEAAEAETQIGLLIQGTDVRMINPRLVLELGTYSLYGLLVASLGEVYLDDVVVLLN